jgi:glycosyltransferase involved in cell wall biosynthesis
MADLVRRLCLDRLVDIVQLEYTQMAEYRNQTGAIPLVLVEHDITFTLYEQIAHISGKPEAATEYRRWVGFEREALQCSNAVWTMSERDRAIALEVGAPRRSTVVVPNGVDLRRFEPVRRQGGERTILFVGSFRHLPNLLAFEALREIIMPAVWIDCPDAKLHVVAGPDYERAARLAGKNALLDPDSRIAVEGFVEDVRPAYRECDVVAIPLPLSAGTNIKVMEAMACGRAIVSTACGCQGLGLRNGSDILVREMGAEFAEGIVRLLRDEELRERMAIEARRTVELRFGWESCAREALGSYMGMVPSLTAPPVCESACFAGAEARPERSAGCAEPHHQAEDHGEHHQKYRREHGRVVHDLLHPRVLPDHLIEELFSREDHRQSQDYRGADESQDARDGTEPRARRNAER